MKKNIRTAYGIGALLILAFLVAKIGYPIEAIRPYALGFFLIVYIPAFTVVGCWICFKPFVFIMNKFSGPIRGKAFTEREAKDNFNSWLK